MGHTTALGDDIFPYFFVYKKKRFKGMKMFCIVLFGPSIINEHVSFWHMCCAEYNIHVPQDSVFQVMQQCQVVNLTTCNVLIFF